MCFFFFLICFCVCFSMTVHLGCVCGSSETRTYSSPENSEGECLILYSDGSAYYGQVKVIPSAETPPLREGFGIHSCSAYTYIGNFQSDAFHGQGKLLISQNNNTVTVVEEICDTFEFGCKHGSVIVQNTTTNEIISTDIYSHGLMISSTTRSPSPTTTAKQTPATPPILPQSNADLTLSDFISNIAKLRDPDKYRKPHVYIYIWCLFVLL